MSNSVHTESFSEPAFPSQPHDGSGNPACAANIGLTKRELFAAMAMQGWLAGCRNAYGEFTAPGAHAHVAAESAVIFADALIAALSDETGVKP